MIEKIAEKIGKYPSISAFAFFISGFLLLLLTNIINNLFLMIIGMIFIIIGGIFAFVLVIKAVFLEHPIFRKGFYSD